ncbi:MAG: hydrogenase 4 subunit F [Acidobacteria bacterium]|nr:MAG: hydrogenase 4 subunit F [Acidobacteriota bacterium]
MILAILLGAPLTAMLLALVLPARAGGRAAAASAVVSIAAAVALWTSVSRGEVAAVGGVLRADALSTLLVLCIAVVAGLAAWVGPGLWGREDLQDSQIRRYVVFSNLFTFTMLGAVTVNNVGLMWVAIEATTIASAMLIPLRVSKPSVEASWKYILIGSVGIALAFVGTVLAYVDFAHHAGAREAALTWTVLLAAAPSLHPEVMRLAFVFLLVGYGTKAGLAPMHTWLPDAHAEAPAPLSAMMSGVLLAVALYAVMRWKAVVDLALPTPFTDELLVALGLLSLAIAGFSLVAQRNYKRMLAYSSIEHTGLTCLGLALGPLGAFAALLHLVNHSLVKSAMFLLSGRMYRRYRTTDLAGVTGLLRTMPVTGALFTAGMLAVVGLPPFGLFLSELALVRAGFARGRYGLMLVVLALLALAFISLVVHLNRMLHGPARAAVDRGEDDRLALVPLVVCLALVVVLGVVVPSPLARLLVMSAEILSR